MQIKITTSFEDEKIIESERPLTIDTMDLLEGQSWIVSLMKETQRQINSIDKETLSAEELKDSI